MNDKEEEITNEVEELKNQVNDLVKANLELKANLSSTLSMLRFTLGIAYNAHPDNDKIRGMVDSLYSLGSEDGSSQ